MTIVPSSRRPTRLAPSDCSRRASASRSPSTTTSNHCRDANGVAFGVGEHDVRLLGQLADVEVIGAQLDRPAHDRPQPQGHRRTR